METTHNQNPAIQSLAEAIIPQEEKDLEFHAVMFFDHLGMDLGIAKEIWQQKNPTGWQHRGTRYFNDAMAALNCYANTRCPASQHISAATEEDLKAKEQEMINNFKDQEWLEENLYPYL